MKTTRVTPGLTLDLPARGEIVTTPRCALRVSAPAAAMVAVSIDGGPWAACRFIAGHWWYQWAAYAGGGHVVSLEARRVDGSVCARASHTVLVRLERDGGDL